MSGEKMTNEELAKELEEMCELEPERPSLIPLAAERLRALERELKEEEDLSSRQADLLIGVVNAIKGEPPERTLWSHHDAAELTAKVVAENAQLRADSERLEWLEREHIETIIVDASGETVRWSIKGLLFHDSLREAIDAARHREAQAQGGGEE